MCHASLPWGNIPFSLFPPDVKQTFTSAVKKTLKRLRQGERIKRCSRALGALLLQHACTCNVVTRAIHARAFPRSYSASKRPAAGTGGASCAFRRRKSLEKEKEGIKGCCWGWTRQESKRTALLSEGNAVHQKPFIAPLFSHPSPFFPPSFFLLHEMR